MERTTLTTIVSQYALHLQAEKGLGAGSRERYVALARGLLALCQQDPKALFLQAEWTLTDVDRRVVETYLNTLKAQRGWKPMSMAFYITALSAFFRFLADRHHVTHNPCAGMRPRLDGGLERPPEGAAEAVLRLFGAEAATLDGARRALLVELMYGAGLRPVAAYGLSALEPDRARGVLRARIGETWHELAVSAEGLARAERYLALRGELLAERAAAAAANPEAPAPPEAPGSTPSGPGQAFAAMPFWLDRRGRACSPARLARQLARAMRAEGLDGGPGSLRLLAARHLGERGADVRSVQRLLGARRLGQLDRFQPPSDMKRVMEQFRRAHPRQGND